MIGVARGAVFILVQKAPCGINLACDGGKIGLADELVKKAAIELDGHTWSFPPKNKYY